MTTPIAAITVDATGAQDAEAIARRMYGWPGDRVAVRHLIDSTYHVTLHREAQPMTTEKLSRLRAAYLAAQRRAERATWYGDHAGHLIAAGDARRILRAIVADDAQRVTAAS